MYSPQLSVWIPKDEFETAVDQRRLKSVLHIATECGHSQILQHVRPPPPARVYGGQIGAPCGCFVMTSLDCFSDQIAEQEDVCNQAQPPLNTARLTVTPVVVQAFVDKLLLWKWNKFAGQHFISASLAYVVLMAVLSALVAMKRTSASGGILGAAVMGCRLQYPENGDFSCPDYRGTADGLPLYTEPSSVLWALEIAVFIGTLGFAGLDLFDAVCFVSERWQQYSHSVDEIDFRCSSMSNLELETKETVDGPPPTPRQAFTDVQGDGEAGSRSTAALKRYHSLNSAKQDRRTLRGFLQFVAPHAFGNSQGPNSMSSVTHNGASAMRLILWAFTLLVVVHFILFATGWIPWAGYPPNVELAFAVLFGYLYLLYFAFGLRGIGHLVVMIGQMLKVSLKQEMPTACQALFEAKPPRS